MTPLAALVRDPEARCGSRWCAPCASCATSPAVPALVTVAQRRRSRGARGGHRHAWSRSTPSTTACGPVGRFLELFSDEYDRSSHRALRGRRSAGGPGPGRPLRDEDTDIREQAALALGILNGTLGAARARRTRCRTRSRRCAARPPPPSARSARPRTASALIPLLSDDRRRGPQPRAAGDRRAAGAARRARPCARCTRRTAARSRGARVLAALSRIGDPAQADLLPGARAGPRSGAQAAGHRGAGPHLRPAAAARVQEGLPAREERRAAAGLQLRPHPARRPRVPGHHRAAACPRARWARAAAATSWRWDRASCPTSTPTSTTPSRRSAPPCATSSPLIGDPDAIAAPDARSSTIRARRWPTARTAPSSGCSARAGRAHRAEARGRVRRRRRWPSPGGACSRARLRRPTAAWPARRATARRCSSRAARRGPAELQKAPTTPTRCTTRAACWPKKAESAPLPTPPAPAVPAARGAGSRRPPPELKPEEIQAIRPLEKAVGRRPGDARRRTWPWPSSWRRTRCASTSARSAGGGEAQEGRAAAPPSRPTGASTSAPTRVVREYRAAIAGRPAATATRRTR